MRLFRMMYLAGSIISMGVISTMSIASPPTTINDIKSYGVYVKGSEGYVKLLAFQHQNASYIEFKYYGEIPFVSRPDNTLELIVYQKDFSAQTISYEIRPMDIVAANTQISMDIEPTDKKDMYKLTYSKPIPAATILQVYQGSWFTYGMAAIALGDPQKELVPIFSDMTQVAYAALPSLEEVISAFPGNKDFKALLPKWQQAQKTEKDNKDYSYVEEAWKNYKDTPKLTLQQRYLDSVISEINGYLQNHADGLHAAEAAKRKAEAEKRLAEIEKQL